MQTLNKEIVRDGRRLCRLRVRVGREHGLPVAPGERVGH